MNTGSSGQLAGKTIGFAGKLASMNRRQAAACVRAHGGAVADLDSATHLDLVVLGEEDPLPGLGDEALPAAVREAVGAGQTELITETALWQRLGMVEPEHALPRLYTPAMLARLLDVSVSVVRRWHRRGLIVPVREVRKLPYFDFQEVATARRLAQLLAAGVSPQSLEKQLAALARCLPDARRPLAQLSAIVHGKQILLRQGEGLLDPGGQYRFDFDQSAEPSSADAAEAALPERPIVLPLARLPVEPAPGPEQLCQAAAELEEADDLPAAVEMYRAALAAGGPNAATCFQLAELLYRLGDLAAARERYYVAIELNEDYVEARANLGCVLAEMGAKELAAAAFNGALAYHPNYADVHYHYARLLDETGKADEAEGHWRAFLELAADSPWAHEARRRLALPADDA